MKPKISFVCPTRNDGYVPHFTLRLQRSLQVLLEQLDAFQLPAEVVYVDWNPPGDRPPLAEVLKPYAKSNMCTVRVISVPAKYHRGFRGWDESGMHLARATNVGWQRGRGHFCLMHLSDLFYPDEVIQKITAIPVDNTKMYRLDRCDVAPAVLDAPYTTRQAFLQSCAHQVETRHEKYPDEEVIKFFGIRPLHTNGCGDFNLIPLQIIRELHGNEEGGTANFLDLDSLILHGAACLGTEEEIWPMPACVYKISHSKMTTKRISNRPSIVESQIIKILQRFVKNPLTQNRIRAWLDIPRRRSTRFKGTFPSFERNFLSRVWKWQKHGYTPLNGENWGLASETLEETFLCKAKWDA